MAEQFKKCPHISIGREIIYNYRIDYQYRINVSCFRKIAEISKKHLEEVKKVFCALLKWIGILEF